MDARKGRTVEIGQSRRKSRTYRPTTSTYLVDLLEQQPPTICSKKRAKPGFTSQNSVLPLTPEKNTGLEGEGIYTYIYIIIYIYIMY